MTTAESLVQRYIDHGPHPEYRAFEQRLHAASGGHRRASDVWKFIDDAVTGAGGFSDGTYLFPFKAETENNQVSDKLARRRAEADYDRFAEHVCNAPWDLISSCSDMIQRSAEGAAKELLESFWADCNGHGMALTDFLEFPFSQARRYPVGWIFMDRPNTPIETEAENRNPALRPYIYAVPTNTVVDWEFDEDGKLVAIAMLEPPTDWDGASECPIRVWTLDEWAVFEIVDKQPSRVSDGVNELGVVPVVPVWNDRPNPGKAYGHSEMLDVARIAQTVYNIDSESREIERKCALFLAIPVKSTKDYDGGKLVVGSDSALVYDGDAGEPRWISPDLTILQRLDERRKAKIESAYDMAHLKALNSGVIQTSSGFHAEVEFQKTERRISRHAAMLESVEKEIGSLYLRFFGIEDAEFSVVYPRDFGVRDMQRLMDEVEKMLGLNLGESSNRAELTKLFKARHPRKSGEEITAMVDEALADRKKVALSDRIKQLSRPAPITATT